MPTKLPNGKTLYEVFIQREHRGILRRRKKFLYAFSKAQAAKITNITNKGWKVYRLREH